jgi:hypothetical protein
VAATNSIGSDQGDRTAVLRVQLAGALERNILEGAYANPALLAGDRVTPVQDWEVGLPTAR